MSSTLSPAPQYGLLLAVAKVAMEEGAIQADVSDGYLLALFPTKDMAKYFQFALPTGLDRALAVTGYKMKYGMTAENEPAIEILYVK